MDHERVRRLDPVDVCRRVLAAGGPDLEPVRLLGGNVGAWLVRDRRSGAEVVLGWAPPLRPGDPGGSLRRRLALADAARGAGVPVPRTLDVVDLPEGDVAVLTELAPGVVLPVGEVPPLHLLGDGPGFALHGPLAERSDRTRRLLDEVRRVGETSGDRLVGDDLVHFDFHFENLLVDPDGFDRVVAVVDWDGARQGDVAVDLAVLALDLGRRALGSGLAERVEAVLSSTTPLALARSVWAHVSLRTVDWAIRHDTAADVEHWLVEAERHLELNDR